MRRFLAICLLMFLPLQFSWAAVASYCGHEAGPKTQHVGHHEHEHGAASVHAGATPAETDERTANTVDSAVDHGVTKTPGTPDLDCTQCHGCCPGMPGAVAAVLADVADAPPGSGVARAAALPAPARPERPQWARLA